LAEKEDGKEQEGEKIGGLRIQGMDIKEVIDNIVLVIGMYSHDSCDPVTN